MRKHRDVQADNNAAAYAPHLHEDGRISVRQNGTVVFLACPDEPAAGAGHQQLEEFRLALALRCRIGAINCRRVVDGIGCCSRWIRKEIAEARELRRIGEGCCDPSAPASGSAGRPRDNFRVLPFGGCVHTKRLHGFKWHCPMSGYCDSDLDQMAELYQQEQKKSISMLLKKINLSQVKYQPYIAK